MQHGTAPCSRRRVTHGKAGYVKAAEDEETATSVLSQHRRHTITWVMKVSDHCFEMTSEAGIDSK